MHYVIHCLDKKGALQTRLDNYDKLKTYLATPPVKVVISGPLVADDGETMIGSFFLVEAESKQAAQAFHDNDPFKHVGVWEEVRINPFLKRMDNR